MSLEKWGENERQVKEDGGRFSEHTTDDEEEYSPGAADCLEESGLVVGHQDVGLVCRDRTFGGMDHGFRTEVRVSDGKRAQVITWLKTAEATEEDFFRSYRFDWQNRNGEDASLLYRIDLNPYAEVPGVYLKPSNAFHVPQGFESREGVTAVALREVLRKMINQLLGLQGVVEKGDFGQTKYDRRFELISHRSPEEVVGDLACRYQKLTVACRKLVDPSRPVKMSKRRRTVA